MVSVTSPNGCVGRDTVQLNVIPPNPGNQGAYEFWFAAPEISYQTIPPAPLIIQGFDRPIKLVFTTSEGPAAIKIEGPANSSFIPIYDTVITDVLKVIDLTPFIDIIENKPSNAVLNFGLHITSTKPVTVYYEVQSDHNSDDFSLKGLNALGTEFIVPAQNRFPNYNYCNPSARNSFTVVATDDSTTVQVIPSRDIEGHIKKDTFSVLLNRGQTWCGKALYRDAANHLGGSFILSNKPVSVTVADDAIFDSVATGFPVNLAGDQLIPRHLCGNQYILYTLGLPSTQLSDETVAYVYAFENSTEIYLNGVFKQIINRGDFYSCSLSTDSITSAFLSASKTIFVYESLLYPGGSFAQSAGAVVPPIGCTGSKRVTFSLLGPLIGSYGYDLFFTTETSNIGNIALYQPPFPPFIPPASSYDTVPGTNNEYVSLRTSIGVLPGFSTYTVYCPTGKFQLAEISHSIQYYARTAFLSDFSSLNLGVDRNICPGDSTLLDAGFGRNSYLWNTGDTTQTIWINVPGTYWVNTTEPGCNLSDTIVISNYPFTPVNLGSDRQICTGDSVLLNAGAGRAWYLWSNGETTQTIWAKNPGSYWVTVPDVHCIVSDTVLVSTTTAPVVTNIPPLSKTICTGESTNIPLFGNEPGIMFHWTATLTLGNISGFSVDSGLVINQILINNGATAGVVIYHITPKIGDCAGAPVDYTVNVNVGDPVNVAIAASANTVCAGTTVTFTATPVNPGTNPIYQWKVNGTNGGSNSPTFAYTPVNGDVVTCILTSSLTVCTSNNPATSNAITMVVNPIQPVSISVSQSANPVCSGTTVNFTALPVNGGSNPSWLWKVNGLVVGSNAPAYSYVPVNGDAVTCTLTSNVQCPSGNPAISGTITMAVNPNLPVGVSIVASSNPFCAATSVTFTASPVNGGTTPGYQWKVNGINAGSNSPVLTYTPSNGDVVTCSLVSSEICNSGNPAQSNPVTMVVNATLLAGITISASANPFCPGSAVTFTATPVNGGSTPVYQWKVNGTNAGTNASTFTYNPQNNDSVRCILTSNLNCVTGNPVSSAKIIMSGTLAPVVTFTSCFDTITTIGAKPFRLKGGIPLGGTYSGPGVNGMTGIFTPSVAGTGLKTISYTYTNVASCSAGKSKTILVQPNPAFTCGSNLTDIRDSKVYPTVQIGSQCWMAANLNYGSYLNSSQVQNDNCLSEKYCYNDVTGNCTKYGGLYQWDEVMKYDDTPAGQGLCPPGWHVPTEPEWTTLFNFYLGSAFAGKPLQDTIMAGFRAQTSGVFYLNSSWSYNGFATLFWTSTPWNAVKAISHGMNVYDFSVSLYPSSRANAFPVRCLRD
jgi:uncharacterized protein (TIGR02145 family)